MSRLHMTLLGAWWAVALTLTAVHAWALSCGDPFMSADLAIESVTVDGEPLDSLSEYGGEFVLISGYNHVTLYVGGYRESMGRVSDPGAEEGE